MKPIRWICPHPDEDGRHHNNTQDRATEVSPFKCPLQRGPNLRLMIHTQHFCRCIEHRTPRTFKLPGEADCTDERRCLGDSPNPFGLAPQPPFLRPSEPDHKVPSLRLPEAAHKRNTIRQQSSPIRKNQGIAEMTFRFRMSTIGFCFSTDSQSHSAPPFTGRLNSSV